MTTVLVTVGPLRFTARVELERAPRTAAVLLALLPFRNRLIQARWSGEAAWVPLGDLAVPVGVENATSYPAPGDILLYPGGYSETELLVPYGPTCFASKLGQLAGNHVLTLTDGRDQLPELGRLVLYEGAQPIAIEVVQ
jgi:hypothetical protein